jgi:hypothetical protein
MIAQRELSKITGLGTILLLFFAFGMTGCASTAENGTRTNVREITRADLEALPYRTAAEAVQNLRPQWLRTRGPRNLGGAEGQIWVYLDDSNLGGIQTLSQISAQQIRSIRFIDGTAASARWGLDHGEGVIYITSITRM